MANSAYPWEPTYGSGLPEKIGDVQDGTANSGAAMAIQADVFAQMLQEQSVQNSPAPIVIVTPIFGGGATIGISYVDQSGTNRDFTFDLS